MLFYTEQTDVFFDELDTTGRAVGRADAIRKYGLIVHEDGSQEVGDVYIGDYEVIKRMYHQEKRSSERSNTATGTAIGSGRRGVTG
jgi:hypothetical protein